MKKRLKVLELLVMDHFKDMRRKSASFYWKIPPNEGGPKWNSAVGAAALHLPKAPQLRHVPFLSRAIPNTANWRRKLSDRGYLLLSCLASVSQSLVSAVRNADNSGQLPRSPPSTFEIFLPYSQHPASFLSGRNCGKGKRIHHRSDKQSVFGLVEGHKLSGTGNQRCSIRGKECVGKGWRKDRKIDCFC